MDEPQFNRYLQAVQAQTANAAERDALRTQAQTVLTCDGSSQDAVRKWFTDVELAAQVIGGGQNNIRLARRTVSGPFRKEVENYIAAWRPAGWNAANDPVPDPLTTPWANLKTHLTTAFLSADEQENARGELERLRQATSEDIQTFNRRFNIIMDRSYPANPDGTRDAEVHLILIKYYGRGIASDTFAKKLAEHHPRIATIEDAQRLVVRLSGAHDNYQRLGRVNSTQVNAVYNNGYDPFESLHRRLDRMELARSVSVYSTDSNDSQSSSGSGKRKKNVKFKQNRGRSDSADRSDRSNSQDRKGQRNGRRRSRDGSKSPHRGRSSSGGRSQSPGRQHDNRYRGNNGNFQQKVKGCRNCGGTGHWSHDCPGSEPSVNYAAGIEWS